METAKLRYSRKTCRRWVCLVLAFCVLFLCFGLPFQTACAVVGISASAIAIIIAGLAAIGITFVSTGAYNTLSDYVGSLLSDYAVDQSVPVGSLFYGTQSGVNSAGQLLLNNRYVQLIQAFGTWLKVKFGLINNSSTQLATPGYSVGDFIAYECPVFADKLGSFRWYYDGPGSAVAICYNRGVVTGGQLNTYCGVLFLSTDAGQVSKWINNDTSPAITASLSYSSNLGMYYFMCQGHTGWERLVTTSGVTTMWSGQASYNWSDVNAILSESDVVIDYNNIGIDIDTDVIALPDDDPNYTSGDGAIVDVGAPWGATLPQVTDQVIPGAWTAGESGVSSLTYENIGSIQDQVNPEGSQVIDQDPENYGVPGLKDVFPFCIPWDLYALLSALAADPVAPSFQWRFYLPNLIDQTITIDLAAFDTVAQIVRTMELLAFCVGLAFETRNLIRG